MTRSEKKGSSSRATIVIALSLAATGTFGTGAVLAHAIDFQVRSKPPNKTEQFTGTWQWMFNGKSFSTMILVQNTYGFTGTVTHLGISKSCIAQWQHRRRAWGQSRTFRRICGMRRPIQKPTCICRSCRRV